MAITIKDVAKRAGVSISTVSRVINNSKPVSNEIKQRVLEVIEDTGYVPNTVARSLVTKKSQVIGVIVPDMADIMIGQLVNGMEEIGKMYGYDILLCNSYGGKEEELKYIRLLQSKQVAGVIFVSWDLQEEHVQYISQLNTPCVYISKKVKKYEDIYAVGIDYHKAAYDMTSYLIENGHKKIALLRNFMDFCSQARDKHSGYVKAMHDNGLEVHEELLKEGDHRGESGYNMMNEILDSGNIPTAVFATNDEVAIGAINAIFDKGLKVPEDISVVGFDDTRMALISRPRLTTLRQPIYDIGAVSIRMLIKLANHESVDEKVIDLPYAIVERESCKKL